MQERKPAPILTAKELEEINAVVSRGGCVEIRRRKDSVVILEVKAKQIKEIQNAVPSGGKE